MPTTTYVSVIDDGNGLLIADHDTQAEADGEVIDHFTEILNDSGCDGLAEGHGYVAQVTSRCTPKIRAHAEDDTDDGAVCRERGWDYWVEGYRMDSEPVQVLVDPASCAYTQRELNAAERSLEQHREFLRHLYASEAGRELGRQVCALMVDTRKDPIPRHIDPDAKR